ncbi:MAG: hypothetical protein WC635_10120 [Bacteriovorax sp.]|jgi:hypothetical protein
MNGKILDEIKKKGDSKKKEKLKFIVTIISTNLLVAALCLNFNTSTGSISSNQPALKIIHPSFKMIIIPLTVLIDVDPQTSEIPVTLMTKSKKILITKAYLHEEIRNTSSNGETTSRFKIEIPENEVLKLSADNEVEMIAIPELKLEPKVSRPVNKRVSHYEVDL